MLVRAMTLRQPHAGHVFNSGDDGDPKDVENRSANIVGSYRGPVVIHAGAQPDSEMLKLWEDPKFPRSVLLGIVDVVSVHHARDCVAGPWSPLKPKLCSRWALSSCVHIVLENPRAFVEPIPYQKGRLGLWLLPHDVAAMVSAAELRKP